MSYDLRSVPVFSGRGVDLDYWYQCVHDYCVLIDLPESRRHAVACCRVSDGPKLLLRGGRFDSLKDVYDLLAEHYGPSQEELFYAFASVAQGPAETVTAFARRARQLHDRLKLSHDFLLRKAFLNGLLPALHAHVVHLCPTTFEDALCHAKFLEDHATQGPAVWAGVDPVQPTFCAFGQIELSTDSSHSLLLEVHSQIDALEDLAATQLVYLSESASASVLSWVSQTRDSLYEEQRSTDCLHSLRTGLRSLLQKVSEMVSPLSSGDYCSSPVIGNDSSTLAFEANPGVTVEPCSLPDSSDDACEPAQPFDPSSCVSADSSYTSTSEIAAHEEDPRPAAAVTVDISVDTTVEASMCEHKMHCYVIPSAEPAKLDAPILSDPVLDCHQPAASEPPRELHSDTNQHVLVASAFVAPAASPTLAVSSVRPLALLAPTTPKPSTADVIVFPADNDDAFSKAAQLSSDPARIDHKSHLPGMLRLGLPMPKTIGTVDAVHSAGVILKPSSSISIFGPQQTFDPGGSILARVDQPHSALGLILQPSSICAPQLSFDPGGSTLAHVDQPSAASGLMLQPSSICASQLIFDPGGSTLAHADQPWSVSGTSNSCTPWKRLTHYLMPGTGIPLVDGGASMYVIDSPIYGTSDDIVICGPVWLDYVFLMQYLHVRLQLFLLASLLAHGSAFQHLASLAAFTEPLDPG